MPEFDISAYCREKHLRSNDVLYWLRLYLKLNVEPKMDLNPTEIIDLKMAISEGEKLNFLVKFIPDKSGALIFLKELIKTEKQRFDHLESSLNTGTSSDSKHTRHTILMLKNRIKKYLRLEKSLTNELNSSKLNIQESSLHRPNKGFLIQTSTASIPWDQITFGEKIIWFGYPDSIPARGKKRTNRFFKGFPMDRSRISFNSVKDLYVNRNLPPIEIEYDNNNILAINNIDVLFYFFLFMENTGIAPIINDQEQIATVYKKYTKDFYLNHLSDLFIPRCFHYLIERAAEDLPIIPIPERVINSSGAESIHDSFLFPMVKKDRCLWVWESVEELKATYIFETSKVSYESEVQTIFDFLTSEFVNKRSTLMKRKVDKKSAPLLIRVNHNDYNEWQKKIGEILN